MTIRIACYLLLASLSLISQAEASSPGYASYSCETIRADAALKPPELVQPLQAVGSAVEICTGRAFRTGEEYKHYYWKSPTVETAFGLCRYQSREMFRDPSTPEVRWTYHRPGSNENPVIRNYVLAVITGSCPQQDDQKYVQVGDVSDGVAKLILERWQTLVSSPEQFSKFIGEVPAEKTLYKPLRDLHDRIQRRQAPHIEISWLQLWSQDFAAYYSMDFRFLDESERGRRVTVGVIFDLTANGLLLLGFREMP